MRHLTPVFVLFLIFTYPASLHAHPVAQGSFEIVIYPDKVTLHASVTVQEICVAEKLLVDDQDIYPAKALIVAFSDHAEYLLKHVYLTLDGKLLSGTLVKIEPPEQARNGIHPLESEKEFVGFSFEYTVSDTSHALPADLSIKHDALNEIMYTPGVPWQASYFTKVRQSDQDEFKPTLLVCNQPLVYHCEWKTVKPVTVEAQQTSFDFWGMAGRYLKAGINHIVGYDDPGYDHILFVSALVLAAVSFWDVIRVVTAFTLAHTLSLSLSVMNIVNLPERVVEPMIAISIVVVAVQNIFWPKRTRGWERLLAAFGFGLFHGLGFAGGLVSAMRGESGLSMALAIATFSIGVEIGHQIVVLPMFGALRWAKSIRAEESAREMFSARAMKYGSMLICLGGVFFLFYALRGNY